MRKKKHTCVWAGIDNCPVCTPSIPSKPAGNEARGDIRKIGFRGWHRVQKRMFEISGVSFERHFVIEKSGSKWDWHDEVIAVMEYSGFQGKNGRETVGIYEGDIIRIQYEDGPAVGDVEFCDGFFRFNVREEALRHPKYFSPFHEQDRPEVIGNIYENPNLLN